MKEVLFKVQEFQDTGSCLRIFRFFLKIFFSHFIKTIRTTLEKTLTKICVIFLWRYVSSYTYSISSNILTVICSDGDNCVFLNFFV